MHPYQLIQYNNGWFLMGPGSGREGISNFAFDRILAMGPDLATAFLTSEIALFARFAEIIGVSFNEAEPVQEIHLRFYDGRGSYVRTKPLYASQPLVASDANTLELTLRLSPNRELEPLLLSFGQDLEVVAPASLRERMQK
ncbi:hypothetical protein B0919_09620 [Hymenobacter sp. CRA2]|nr:hypothetical protein B0919_09620 [Hymenobacter sp. CRA2]